MSLVENLIEQPTESSNNKSLKRINGCIISQSYEKSLKSKNNNGEESNMSASPNRPLLSIQKMDVQSSNELKQTRILMAESEPEILTLFKTYLDSLGVESVTVDNGDKAVETFLQSKTEGKVYDAVVLNTHLKGKKGLEVAKKIRQNDKSQRIVLVTTSIKEQLPQEDLHSSAIKDEDILVIPFALSRLSKLLIDNSMSPSYV
jgi:CheY-like chemotaxis protein